MNGQGVIRKLQLAGGYTSDDTSSDKFSKGSDEESPVMPRRKTIKNKKVLKRITKAAKPSGPPELVLDAVYPEYLISSKLQVGHAEFIGKRNEMEDAVCIKTIYRGSENESFFGLFDGHGGKDVSDYAALHFETMLASKLDDALKTVDPKTPGKSEDDVILQAIHNTFMELNEIVNSPEVNLIGGSTAAIAYLRGQRLYVANAGDSRVVLSRGCNEALRLTVDHRPTEEEEAVRIQSVGGFVRDNRVNGILAVSRSLGDSFLYPMVTAEPHMTVTNILPDDNFLILACDGLWDVLTDGVAVAQVKSEPDPRVSSAKVRDYGFAMGSTDNISVVVVKFCNNNATMDMSNESTAATAKNDNNDSPSNSTQLNVDEQEYFEEMQKKKKKNLEVKKKAWKNLKQELLSKVPTFDRSAEEEDFFFFCIS